MNNLKQDSSSAQFWRWLPWLVLLLLFCLTLFFGQLIRGRMAAKAELEKNGPAAPKTPINVVTQVIVPTTLVDRINLPAKVKAWEDIMVKAEVTGRIIEVAVKEGEPVQEGQVIARIDSRDYEAQLASVRARLELAVATLTRTEKLIASDAVSREQYDNARAAKEELAAALVNADLSLERCTIRSPINGVINNLPARVGMLLSHADPVAQVINRERLKVEVGIPEAEVAAVGKVDQATVVLAALGDRSLTGRKYFLAGQPLGAAMVYTLQLAMDNPTNDILPGMFARVEIVKRTWRDTVAVPLFSVISQGEDRSVFVVEESVAHRRPVVTGILEDWRIQLVKGVKPGDQVVIVGHRGLEEGQPVKVVKTVTDPKEILP